MTPAAPPRLASSVSAQPAQTPLELAALPSAVPCARGHVKAVARERGLADLSATAELLTSELTTNAIQESARVRACSDPSFVPVVRLWLTADDSSLVIHVWDSSEKMPARKNAGADAEGGRGLLLVQALSSSCGVYREPEGKVVWARVSR